ncbi:MAG: glycosyltransferase family 39 protein [bacterium]|nr:glycosyltransferase family 39 protein [bacterium]
MNSLNRPKNLEDAAQEFMIFGAVFFLALTGLAIFGVFQRWLVLLLFCLFLLAAGFRFWYLCAFRKIVLSRWHKGIIIFLLCVTLFNAWHHHDLPSSRDNIGYLTAGAMLSKTGKLHFQDIISRPYHPYREIALGKDVFTSQFMPGYNAFLGFCYSLGGLSLALSSGAFLFALFLICLYGAARKIIGKRKIAFLALIFTVTFFAFLWFPRRTNSENLFIVLLWLGLWLFLRGLEAKNLRRMLWGFLPVSLTVLTRGEGLLYLGAFTLSFCFAAWKLRSQIRKEKFSFLLLLFPLFALFLFWRYVVIYSGIYLWGHAVSILYNLGDFIVLWLPVNLLSLARHAALYKLFIFIILIIIAAAGYCVYKWRGSFAFLLRKFSSRAKKGQFILAILLTAFFVFNLILIYHYHSLEFVNWQTYRIQYVFIILGKYFLLPYFLIFLIALWGRKKISRHAYYAAFLLSPVVLFILDPFVGLDQPWFLRRFYPTLIPFLFILSAWGLCSLNLSKKLRGVIAVLLVAINLWVSWPIIFFREYQGVQSGLEDLASRLDENSLTLMDPGWQWQQWGYALHYLYNRDVLPEYDRYTEAEIQKLIADHPAVFVISRKSPEEKDILDYPGFPNSSLKYLFETKIKYPLLLPTTNLTDYVMDKEIAVSTVILLQKYQEALPRERDVESIMLYVYQYK